MERQQVAGGTTKTLLPGLYVVLRLPSRVRKKRCHACGVKVLISLAI